MDELDDQLRVLPDLGRPFYISTVAMSVDIYGLLSGSEQQSQERCSTTENTSILVEKFWTKYLSRTERERERPRLTSRLVVRTSRFVVRFW